MSTSTTNSQPTTTVDMMANRCIVEAGHFSFSLTQQCSDDNHNSINDDEVMTTTILLHQQHNVYQCQMLEQFLSLVLRTYHTVSLNQESQSIGP